MMKRENTISFACGKKGSGKSHWLLEKFVRQAPRVIHIDPNGDFLDDKEVLIVNGYRGLLDALHAMAAVDQQDWRIAVSLDDPKQIARLFDLVAPRADFGKGSLSRAFDGIAIECGECDVIAPNGQTLPEIASAWRRGRHHQLDLFMGTQRPAACDRLLSSQADVVACFYMDEPIDIDWVARKFGRTAAEQVSTLPEYWHIEKSQIERTIGLVNAHGVRVENIGDGNRIK